MKRFLCYAGLVVLGYFIGVSNANPQSSIEEVSIVSLGYNDIPVNFYLHNFRQFGSRVNYGKPYRVFFTYRNGRSEDFVCELSNH